MAFGVDSYEDLFSYWLAKINAMKKYVKMLRQPHSQYSGEPCLVSARVIEQPLSLYEDLLSFWLAKINVMKKYVKMLRQPHSQYSGEPCLVMLR